MPFTFGRLYRRLGAAYFAIFLAFELFSGLIITLATVGLFSLYEDMSAATFWWIVLAAEGCVVAASVYVGLKTRRLALPLVRWVKEGQEETGAPEAWRLAVSLPR